jgi:hypothetical protein
VEPNKNSDTDESAQRSKKINTRRGVLAGTGALGALALGGAFTVPMVAADEHGGQGGDPFEDGVAILDNARRLEALEYRVY